MFHWIRTNYYFIIIISTISHYVSIFKKMNYVLKINFYAERFICNSKKLPFLNYEIFIKFSYIFLKLHYHFIFVLKLQLHLHIHTRINIIFQSENSSVIFGIFYFIMCFKKIKCKSQILN